MKLPHSLFIGWDVKEQAAWNVAQFSAHVSSSVPVNVTRLAMQNLQHRGLYTRPTQMRDVGYWDEISAAPMSTGHAIARFLVPYLCKFEGWALFTDGDVLFRRNVGDLFALADERYAVQVVQHQHAPIETVKMAGHVQTCYARKNWSSVALWNCAHPANRALTLDLVNTVPGRDLHRFCWLDDDLIGALPHEWNHLVNVSPRVEDAAIAHFTEGTPELAGYEHVPFANEWYGIAQACGYRFSRPPAVEQQVAV